MAPGGLQVMLGNGLRVTDLRLGGGDYPRDGDFVVVAFTAKVVRRSRQPSHGCSPFLSAAGLIG